MKLTQDTTILTLIQDYPFLIEALAERNPVFVKLKNPILRNTLGRVATVAKAAAMGKEKPLGLLLFIADRIMTATGDPVEITPPKVQERAGSPQPLSSEQRLEGLKEMIRELHNGADIKSLREKFAKTVGDISPEEIARLEQTLVNEGLQETEIKKLCNLHIWSFTVSSLRDLVAELAAVKTHYVRKENQLFPLLEAHGIEAPTKVMWEVHDDIRRQLKTSGELLQGPDRFATRRALLELTELIGDMIYKEERILFPMALETMNEQDWATARLGDDEIGYCYDVVPGSDWVPARMQMESDSMQTGLIDLATGQLSPEVIDAMLRNLTVDMSLVDPEDKVAYYSDSSHRIFPRSPAVIGRDVKNCHPPKSVHMVTEILEKFKSGIRDNAEFWLELEGKFIHIKYIALRSSSGKYLGCLEVAQDATHVRSLKGQRRLLEWE